MTSTVLVAAVLAALTTTVASARTAAVGWSILSTPNPPGAAYTVLNSVSCSSVTACTAVGYWAKRGASPFALVERWNGSSWVLQMTPAPSGAKSDGFYGVSCAAHSVCMAIGFTATRNTVLPLAEEWSDGRWRIVPTPRPQGASSWGLAGVSCKAPGACTAVGSYAVGSAQNQPLAERWDGHSWVIQSTPNPHAENGSAATAVFCPTTRACTAVAVFAFADINQTVFALRWNGSTWSTTRQPNPGGQIMNAENSVSCSAATACTSVGFWTDVGSLPLAERWNGTAWRRQPVPSPNGSAESSLSGVSCPSARSCMAVGTRAKTQNGYPSSTLAEIWQGETWSVVATPSPSGASVANLASVSCTSPNACIAVGSVDIGSTTRSLAEIYSG